MSLYDTYATFTDSTARYPVTLEKPYLALGLCDETADELRSAYRRGDLSDMFLELGDGQWYACRLAKAYGLSFDEIVNMAKGMRGSEVPRNLTDAITDLAVVAGKIAGRVKKEARDGMTWNARSRGEHRENIKSLLALYVVTSFVVLDNMWRLSRKTGNYDQLLERNRDKLASRLERDTLRGDGDHR